ncbi:ABC1 kinase family protein [Corynebacterium halotolerans]|uniref:Protein kinase domain-containing protein n=1 Tax=Corynebacterium halotolerans YIM 70093 = DSM 44683 TaxID=1121362 RepID=M1NSH1_9CORY|nr:AarF/UbiB family protein [Corynebacterium halotolerans]AGF72412.1 hypothetical protein A605_07050 [Corynebacterium halotolerans YIM 70093 = DSM 44683]
MDQFLEQFGTVGSWVTSALLLVLGILLLLGVTWILASVMRRLLGVPVGWPRTTVISLLVVLLTAGLFNTVINQFHTAEGGALSGISPTAGLILLLIALLWMLGFGAATLMILELIAPTGSWPNVFAWVADAGDRRARNRRYRQVLTIFVRNGLTSGVPGFGRHRTRGGESTDDRESLRRTARSLRVALEEAGTTFVKLGQNLSTRTDVLPPEFISELSRLQTQAAPEPWGPIHAALTESLGRDPAEVYAWIDHEPLASASVAQVHRARLTDGTEVVLKIQRPGTREEVTRDSDIVMRLCGWLDRNTGWGRNLGIRQLAARFTESLAEELDYRIEAANMKDLEHALADGPVTMPRVHPEHSSTRLLVMDLMDGTTVGRAGRELSHLPERTRIRLGEELLVSVMHQIMRHGVFHADVHPGNVLLLETDDGPLLGLLDFGAVGHLDAGAQQQLAIVFAALEQGDARVLTDALIELLGRPRDLDDRALERQVGELMIRYRNGLRGGSASELFGRLMAMIVANRFEVPAGVAAAFRALGGAEGTLALITPDLDIVETARTVGSDMTRSQFRPDNLKDAANAVMLETIPLLRKLPRRISHITEDLHDGRLSVNVRVLAHAEDRNFITRLFQQFTIAVLAGFCVLGGIVLIAFGEGGPALTDYLSWQAALGYIVLFAGFLLSLRIVTLVLYHGNRDSLAG